MTGTETTLAAQPPRKQVEQPADAGVALKVGDMIDGLVDTEVTPALQALEHDGAAAPFDEATAGPGQTPADEVDPLAALVAAFPGPPPDEAELEDAAGPEPGQAAPAAAAETPSETPPAPPVPPAVDGTAGFDFCANA